MSVPYYQFLATLIIIFSGWTLLKLPHNWQWGELKPWQFMAALENSTHVSKTGNATRSVWRAISSQMGLALLLQNKDGPFYSVCACGPTTYQLIRNLIAPDKPTDKTFAQLVKLVKDHHPHPRPSSIVARKNFHERTCIPEESVSDFVAELCKLSEYCEFGNKRSWIYLWPKAMDQA